MQEAVLAAAQKAGADVRRTASMPDTHFAGPELAPADEAAHKAFFGE